MNHSSSTRQINNVPQCPRRGRGSNKVNTPDEKSKVTLAASVCLSSRGQQAGDNNNSRLLALHRRGESAVVKQQKAKCPGVRRGQEKGECRTKEPQESCVVSVLTVPLFSLHLCLSQGLTHSHTTTQTLWTCCWLK